MVEPDPIPFPLSEVDLSTPLSAATDYSLKLGYHVVPLPPRSKKITAAGWESWRLTAEQLPELFKADSNIGVLLGAAANGPTDIDLDCSQAIVLARVFLPETGAIFGRAGKPGSHWLYHVGGGSKTVHFKDIDGAMLVELRGDGGQTVFPPSTHKDTGELIRFDVAGVPAPAEYADLLSRVQKLAAACILARHWPQQGGRHDAAMALAGGLLRARWSIEDAEHFIRAVAEAAGDDEVEDRVSCVATTQARLEAGAEATGLNHLRDLIDKKVIDRARKWLNIAKVAAPASGESPYLSMPTGLIYMKATKDGPVPVQLTNWNAEITADVLEDDGVETRRTFEIQAALAGHQPSRFIVPAEEFGALDWAVKHLGSKAVVFPGHNAAPHTKTAIQLLSNDTASRTVYGHTGWRKINDKWMFLHGGGGIGAEGLVNQVEVSLTGTLTHYILPAPPIGQDLTTAIHATMKLLALTPAEAGYPVVAALFRGLLGDVDFSIWIVGRTGAFKSELAALLQRHCGTGFTARNLPGSWSSTANATEDLAFRAKDVVFVIDDFKPSGTGDDKLHQMADRVLRAAGNGSGRQRMRADTSLRAARPPRSMIFCTGEDLPRGQSLRARLGIVELKKGDISAPALTACQKQADEGWYGKTVAAFCCWLAPRYEQVKKEMKDRADGLRHAFAAEVAGGHARLPGMLADLYVGYEIFLRFAVESTAGEAIAREEVPEELERCRRAMVEFGRAQLPHQVAADPPERYFELLRSALSSGKAHVAGPDGQRPQNAEAWGWRVDTEQVSKSWRAMGDRIGWVSGDDLYLDAGAAYRIAQAQVADGDAISATERMLARHLHEKKYLLSTEHGSQGTFTARRSLEGKQRRVLHIRAAELAETDDDRDISEIPV